MALIEYHGEDFAISPTKTARRTLLCGAAIILVAVLGFFLWSALAPLSSAAVSRGHVTVYGYRKAIQHLEGGIVSKIMVENGSKVEAGDLLLKLDETRARASLNLISERYYGALSELLRLKLEQEGKTEFALPPALMAKIESPSVRRMIEEQKGIFEARRASIDGAVMILEQQIKQAQEEIRGLQAQIKSHDEQTVLITDELEGLEKLYAKGLVPKHRLRSLQRKEAEILGQKGAAQAEIARARQAIGEARVEIRDVQNRHLEEISNAIREVQQSVAESKERMLATRDILERVDIRAPVSGVVVGLQVHTEGGVVAPGDTLMEIVPESDKLIVETRIEPQDIDAVHPGLPAKIRLSAFDRRSTPPIDGSVFYVSADRVQGEQSVAVGLEQKEDPAAPYYLARISLDPKSLAEAGNLSLYPGMPADVMVVTGERTMLDYILSPVGQAFDRALREE